MAKRKKKHNRVAATGGKAASDSGRKSAASATESGIKTDAPAADDEIVRSWKAAGTRQDRGIKPPSGEKENVKKARYGGFSRLPAVVKCFLIKGWLSGAVYFFIGFGVFIQNSDGLDMMAVLGLVTGLLTNLLLNRFLMSVDGEKQDMHLWITTKNRKWYFVFVDLVYAVFLTVLVSYTYGLINMSVISARGMPSDSVPFPAEPVTFGLFYFLYDIGALWTRNLAIYIFRKMKARRGVLEA